MIQINLALIYGGRSSEREVSINGGNQVFDALDKKKYNITKYDSKTDLGRLVQDSEKIDVALIILHGAFGEDGTIQGLLELLQIPYQGSGVLGSALAIDKIASKKMYEQNGLPIPPYVAISKGSEIDNKKIIEKLKLPVFVKPSKGGSSIGMSLVNLESELPDAISKALKFDNHVLIESFIDGVELTCSVIGNNDLIALPVIEIIPDNGTSIFFDYEAKYTPGASKEICPAGISEKLAQKVQALAKEAHKALYLKGYSRTDMILRGDDIYILETNTIPGMTKTSLLPLAAKTAGISFSQLLDKLIALALEKEL